MDNFNMNGVWRSAYALIALSLCVQLCTYISGCSSPNSHAVNCSIGVENDSRPSVGPNLAAALGVHTTVVDYHPTGRLASWCRCDAKGRQHGLYLYWYNSGHLCVQGEFVAGRKSGLWLTYWESGRLKQMGSYNDHNPVGEWRDFREDGTLSFVNHYHESGFLLTLEYYDNGRVRGLAEKMNGVNHGKFLLFHENGGLASVGEYNNETPVGTWRTYDSEGKLVNETSYSAD